MSDRFINSKTIRCSQTESGRVSRVNKLFLAIAVFALFLILCTTPSGAHVVSEHDEWIAIGSLDEIKESGSYYLTKDVTLTKTWVVPSGKVINLCLNGHVIKQVSKDNSVIHISGSGTQLNLYDCSNVRHYFDKNEDTGLWTLNDAKKTSSYNVMGGVITGGKQEGTSEEYGMGGGLLVDNGGEFVMYGGNIVGNNAELGGGVFCKEGTFTMHGGNIVGNTAISYYTHGSGGGVCNDAGEFTMYGGNIVNNYAQEGGGVYNNYRSKFTMHGGNIASNILARVMLYNGHYYTGTGGGVSGSGDFTMYGGNIIDNSKTGVIILYGSFTMYDGYITGHNGGGVHSGDNFTMYGGNIVGNTAYMGGGVLSENSFIMYGGNIVGNTATKYGGGGVSTGNNFTMYGGNIANNIASNTVEYGGGGVWHYFGNFTMLGGKITGNTAEYGANVYVCNTFNISDDVTINELCLATYSKKEHGIIRISGDEFNQYVSNIVIRNMGFGDVIVEIDELSSLTAQDILGKFSLKDTSKTLIASEDNKKLIVAENTQPTPYPTKTPTVVPTKPYTPVPTKTPTVIPTKPYTPIPTKTPTVIPTKPYTPIPTKTPTVIPTKPYTPIPTKTPTVIPTKPYTPIPTKTPTVVPTKPYTPIPTKTPTVIPTKPYTPIPTKTPTVVPTPTKTPTPSPAPKFSGAALSLSTDIAVRFNVNDTALEGYSNPYIDVTFNGAEYKNIRAVHDAVAEKQRFTFRNISPAEMNDVIIAKLYATKDGESAPVLCDTREYSVKQYCDNMLNKESTHSLLKTLCVDLLNYGSASQVYTGETDASKFANYTLTPTQKSWASTTITPAVRNDQSVSETGDDSVGVWRSASLNLYSDISLILKFTTDVDVSNLEAEIKYGVDLGETATVTGFTDSTYSGGDCKQIKFNKMNAQELNYPVEITLIDKITGKRSKTLTYSVDAYSYSKIDGGGNLGTLVTSIMKYIRSVDRIA